MVSRRLAWVATNAKECNNSKNKHKNILEAIKQQKTSAHAFQIKSVFRIGFHALPKPCLSSTYLYKFLISQQAILFEPVWIRQTFHNFCFSQLFNA